MKKITKKEREVLKQKFGGKCAYCGVTLSERWHADHIEAIHRNWWNPDKKGECDRPENDNIANMNPSCAPCNIDKHASTLEGWRMKLSRTLDVLNRNNPTYRHAKRFGLIEETQSEIIFYFEKIYRIKNESSS